MAEYCIILEPLSAKPAAFYDTPEEALAAAKQMAKGESAEIAWCPDGKNPTKWMAYITNSGTVKYTRFWPGYDAVAKALHNVMNRLGIRVAANPSAQVRDDAFEFIAAFQRATDMSIERFGSDMKYGPSELADALDTLRELIMKLKLASNDVIQGLRYTHDKVALAQGWPKTTF